MKDKRIEMMIIDDPYCDDNGNDVDEFIKLFPADHFKVSKAASSLQSFGRAMRKLNEAHILEAKALALKYPLGNQQDHQFRGGRRKKGGRTRYKRE